MSPANASLVFPTDRELRQLSDKRIPLILGPPRSNSLVDLDAEAVTAETFRRLRVKLGAWIETDDPARVRDALAVPDDEPGIVMVPRTGSCRGMLPPGQ